MTEPFQTLSDVAATLKNLPGPDAAAQSVAATRNASLTKPPGALGRLEEMAIWYCGWRGEPKASLNSPQVIVFAGNHGVARQGVSAFPADVTVQMVANFEAGGAAINQLADLSGARLDVCPLSLEHPTADFTQGPAMSEPEAVAALCAGWKAVDPDADLLVVGEMGIGNTTCAAAIALALYGGEASEWTGAGTGVEGDTLAAKTRAVAAGVAANPTARGRGLEALRCLGGREIAAMSGAILRARLARIPVLLDGYICSAAAACLHNVATDALDHCVAGHLSDEAAHGALLKWLGKPPLLALGMRLGEASGGALSIAVLRAALACHSGMASFDEAGVSKG
ncbi:MAG: nicotinate-nucleotide--dimethylbenzimidazole phosphoribosyltransferase [Pseudomonadota bacterium]